MDNLAGFGRKFRQIATLKKGVLPVKGEKLEPFFSKVYGVTHKNADGTDRQALLRKCRVGETLVLTHEPIPEDPNAVKVCRQTGEQIGWLSASLAAEIAPRLDKGSRVDVVITDLTGGGWLIKKKRGCNIQITKYSLR